MHPKQRNSPSSATAQEWFSPTVTDDQVLTTGSMTGSSSSTHPTPWVRPTRNTTATASRLRDNGLPLRSRSYRRKRLLVNTRAGSLPPGHGSTRTLARIREHDP